MAVPVRRTCSSQRSFISRLCHKHRTWQRLQGCWEVFRRRRSISTNWSSFISHPHRLSFSPWCIFLHWDSSSIKSHPFVSVYLWQAHRTVHSLKASPLFFSLSFLQTPQRYRQTSRSLRKWILESKSCKHKCP